MIYLSMIVGAIIGCTFGSILYNRIDEWKERK